MAIKLFLRARKHTVLTALHALWFPVEGRKNKKKKKNIFCVGSVVSSSVWWMGCTAQAG